MIRNKIAAAFGVVALSAGLGLVAAPAHAGPPPPLSPRFIVSEDGAGQIMDTCVVPLTGNTINFGANPSGCYTDDMVFDLKSGGQYEIHPNGNTQICVTFSTTQYGVIKAEYCVGSGGASNQLFLDETVGGGDYGIYNIAQNEFINDPHPNSGTQHIAGWINPCDLSGHGTCNMNQSVY